MRIVSVCRTLPTPSSPGAGIFVLKRLEAMAELADLRVLQPVPYLPGIRSLPTWARQGTHVAGRLLITHQPMLYVPGVLKSLDGIWLGRSVLPTLRLWRQRAPIDVIDAHFGYPDGVGCVAAARRLNLPVFVTVRGLEADRLKRPAIRRQMIAALNAATGCISVSHALRRLLVAHGVPGDRIEVIPNGIDREVFRPGRQQAARRALDLTADEQLVVSVGHLISGKGHDTVMRALASLTPAHPNLQLAIVGGADYEPGWPAVLRKLAADLAIEKRVRFVGAVPPERVAEWLRAADVFALATVREGCCNAILEALACGTPVVTTPVGDNAEYVVDGANGHLVPVGRPDSVAAAIDVSLRRRWDRQAISRGLRVLGWNHTGAEVLQFFERRLAATRGYAA